LGVVDERIETHKSGNPKRSRYWGIGRANYPCFPGCSGGAVIVIDYHSGSLPLQYYLIGVHSELVHSWSDPTISAFNPESDDDEMEDSGAPVLAQATAAAAVAAAAAATAVESSSSSHRSDSVSFSSSLNSGPEDSALRSEDETESEALDTIPALKKELIRLKEKVEAVAWATSQTSRAQTGPDRYWSPVHNKQH